jgi:trehalose-phosphatase
MLPELVRDFLVRRVARAPSILALDYDGTLAPFQVERMAAVPLAAVVPPLERLLDEPSTTVVIVSGRPVQELEMLLPVTPLPELWGVHGWERQRPGQPIERMPLPPAAEGALLQEEQRLQAAGIGERIERKSAALALHWRGLATQQAIELQDLVREHWGDLGRRYGFVVRPFDGGMELRHGAHDKGEVVAALLARVPAGTPLAYVGDDDTDEDAFRALTTPELIEQALGIRVRTVPAATAARAELSPDDLPDFLIAWLEASARVRAGKPTDYAT